MSDNNNRRQSQIEDKDGLSKYMKRVKTVLRRGSSAESSLNEPSSPGPGPSHSRTASKSTLPSAPAASAPPVPAKQSSNTTSSKSESKKSEPKKSEPKNAEPKKAEQPKKAPTTVPHWGVIQQDRTRSLFAKYGLTINDDYRQPDDSAVQRVIKPVRMRVHRTCHRCQTPFGSHKTCVNCQHARCNKCPRYPPKKDKDAKDKIEPSSFQAIKQPPVDRTRKNQPSQKNLLTMPSRTGGQDLVRKPIRQRIHRYCHRCKTEFVRDATECAKCRHIRCKKCPRDPAKPHKYPDGYPGDAEPPNERTWKKPRRRVRHICHKCSTMYQAGSNECSNCGQVKGPETIRDPPKKVKPEPDPEVVRRVEERLSKISLGKE